MTAFTGSLWAYDILVILRDAITSAMQSSGNSPFARVGIVPGAIAWDDCDQCGLLALSMTQHFLSDDFPAPVSAAVVNNRGSVLGADLVIQAIRCVPTSTGTGAAPSTDALDRSAQQIMNDAMIIFCAVDLTLSDLDNTNRIEQYMIRRQAIVGPEGACGGSELSVAVGIPY